jgi:hypothetical protein
VGAAPREQLGRGVPASGLARGRCRRAAYCYRERGKEAQAGGTHLDVGRHHEQLKRECRRASPYGAGSAPVGQVDEDDANEWRSSSG